MGRSPTVSATAGQGEQPPVHPEPVDFMLGTWVTSFSGAVHDDPQDDHDIPRIPAYAMPNGHQAKSGGYFFAASLLILKFDGQGSFAGKVQIIRGGSPAPQPVVNGTYQLAPNPALGVIEGTINAHYPTPDPTTDILSTYAFVARSRDEIEWLRTFSELDGKPFRLQIAQGTLKRVTFQP